MTPVAVTEPPSTVSLIELLGEPRSILVKSLRARPGATVSDLAEELGISTVATRRHLAVLESEGLVTSTSVPEGRGRPVQRWELTEAAGALLPHRYDAFAGELLAFLRQRLGHRAFRDFLRWRMEREVAGLAQSVTAEQLHERLDQLSTELSKAGFDASVQSDGRAFMLIQGHCAIEDIARQHPEICAYEAASFSRVLGTDVTIRRRETVASGARQCVCTVAPKRPERAEPNGSDAHGHSAAPPDRRLPTTGAATTTAGSTDAIEGDRS